MSKLLVSDALTRIAKECLPGDSSRNLEYLNGVTETVHSLGKFSKMVRRWRGINVATSFAVYFDNQNIPYFTLPRRLHSVLGAGYMYSTQNPQTSQWPIRVSGQTINGPWHTFGSGAYGSVWDRSIQDLGDNHTTFCDCYEPFYLRIVTTQTENGASPNLMLFRALDQNGDRIFSGTGASTIEGMTVDISTGTLITTSQAFSRVPYLIQKPVTFGPVYLYAVPVSGNPPILIGIYDPGETSPEYRRYAMGGPVKLVPGQFASVNAWCKRRFVPVVSNSDELVPSNCAALELGLQARRYDLEANEKMATEFWQHAIELLNGELNEHNGAARPTIILQRGLGVGLMPSINC